VIELGPGLFVVQAASMYYFGSSVDFLTLEEIVRLVAVIPRPLSSNPRGDSPWINWRCRWILHKLQLYEFISEETYQDLVSIFEEDSQ
jgi:monofunctional biosynthetic peptidoglycan transglycosylase